MAIEQTITTTQNFSGDIPLSFAVQAHNGVSFRPEKRGEDTVTEYVDTLRKTYEFLAKHATTEEKRALLDEEFGRLRAGYRARYHAWLASKSRCVSSMIVGPSNFPARRMEKRNMVEHARMTEVVEFLPRAVAAILKKLHPEWRPIMAGDDNATDRLAVKIQQAELLQERMKAANAAIRKHKKAGFHAQLAALVELGIDAGRAELLLKPDYAGRIGFADYELTNNNANIRRMKERLATISRDKAKDDTTATGAAGRVEDCPADNRVRVFFDEKPNDATRAELKKHGFRWARSIGAWQAYRKSWTIAYANEVAGVSKGE